MRSKWFFPILFIILLFSLDPSLTLAKGASLRSQIEAYDGMSFKGFEDPAYLSYDQDLREYLVSRIDRQFGIALDPKKYSGFDLLEIEALFRCKKPNEPFDMFLKMFPRRR
jgi:hypothetical protein